MNYSRYAHLLTTRSPAVDLKRNEYLGVSFDGEVYSKPLIVALKGSEGGSLDAIDSSDHSLSPASQAKSEGARSGRSHARSGEDHQGAPPPKRSSKNRLNQSTDDPDSPSHQEMLTDNDGPPPQGEDEALVGSYLSNLERVQALDERRHHQKELKKSKRRPGRSSSPKKKNQAQSKTSDQNTSTAPSGSGGSNDESQRTQRRSKRRRHPSQRNKSKDGGGA